MNLSDASLSSVNPEEAEARSGFVNEAAIMSMAS